MVLGVHPPRCTPVMYQRYTVAKGLLYFYESKFNFLFFFHPPRLSSNLPLLRSRTKLGNFFCKELAKNLKRTHGAKARDNGWGGKCATFFTAIQRVPGTIVTSGKKAKAEERGLERHFAVGIVEVLKVLIRNLLKKN